ncbi:MAG: RsmE family RNA methyltransferase, partial [candidate division NC10 bacterium]
ATTPGEGGGKAGLLGTTLAANLPASLPRDARVHLLIGPEGGLSRDEVDAARARAWKVVGVGPRILRTETAGPAIIAILQNRFGDVT